MGIYGYAGRRMESEHVRENFACGAEYEGSSPRLLTLICFAPNFTIAEIVRMWPGGPLRQFIAGDRHPGGSFIRYGSTILIGFAGSYTCDVCRRSAGGLYCVAQLNDQLAHTLQTSFAEV